uniref:Secreted protein n=1 Tax=Anopheles darlingi TaxID=43151 RepID=A0A2M4DHN3_ANODA
MPISRMWRLRSLSLSRLLLLVPAPGNRATGPTFEPTGRVLLLLLLLVDAVINDLTPVVSFPFIIRYRLMTAVAEEFVRLPGFIARGLLPIRFGLFLRFSLLTDSVTLPFIDARRSTLSSMSASTFDSTSTLENIESVSLPSVEFMQKVEFGLSQPSPPPPIGSSSSDVSEPSSARSPTDGGCFLSRRPPPFRNIPPAGSVTSSFGTLRRCCCWIIGFALVGVFRMTVVLFVATATGLKIRARLTCLGFLKTLPCSSWCRSPCDAPMPTPASDGSVSDSLSSCRLIVRLYEVPLAVPSSVGRSTASSEHSDRLAMSSMLLSLPLVLNSSLRWAPCWLSSSKKVTPRCRWLSLTSLRIFSSVTLSNRSMPRKSR